MKINWRFWEKEKHEKNEEIAALKTQLDAADEKANELTEQLQKLTRLQYKTGKNLEEKIDQLSELVSAQTTVSSGLLEPAAFKIIEKIDEMDLVYVNLAAESEWKPLIINWTRSLAEILQADFALVESIQPGDWFDPALSEAADTISPQDAKANGYEPLQIVEVYKRGYVNTDNKLIRKAQVCTVKEEVTA